MATKRKTKGDIGVRQFFHCRGAQSISYLPDAGAWPEALPFFGDVFGLLLVVRIACAWLLGVLVASHWLGAHPFLDHSDRCLNCECFSFSLWEWSPIHFWALPVRA